MFYKSLSPGAIGVRADLAVVADMAAANGFDAVHVNIREVAAIGATQARDLLANAGVIAAGFGFPIDHRKPLAEFEADLLDLEYLCKVAQAVGLTRTTTWIPSWHDALDFEENYAFHVERLRRAAAILADHDIRFGLEFLGPKTLRDGHACEFIHTMADMLRLCADIDRAIGAANGVGNMGLLLDAYHWYTSHGTLDQLAKLHDSDIVDVHINDALPGPIDELPDTVRALPGETGVIDLSGFLATLKRIGYEGPVMVEPFSKRLNEMPPEAAVAETAAAMNKVWAAAGL
jgi:sugar phosphate isomerase/epimerase